MQSLPYPEVVRWGLVTIVGLTLAVAAYLHPEFIILPVYIAILAMPTLDRLTVRFGSRPLALVAVILGVTLLLAVTLFVVVVPLAVQVVNLAKNFPDLMQVYVPEARRLLDEVEKRLADYNMMDKDLNVALGDLILLFSKTFTEGGGALATITALVLAPLTVFGKGAIILVLVAFYLGGWHSLWAKTMSQLGHYTPALASWMENTVPEIQSIGRSVMFGYAVVVCVLTPIFVAFFVAMSAWVEPQAGFTLANIFIISFCFGIISALPALGAKVGLAAVVLIAMLGFGFSLPVTLVTIVFGLLITTLESKFLTPKLMGRALGLNSALILTIAIASILIGGISGTLWTIFVALPVLIAVHRVYTRQSAPLAKEELA